MISGYCIADVVLRTKAGKVILPQTHIDVLQGPESGNLLYVGQVEEQRLGLKSFRKQIESLAADITHGKKKQPTAPKKAKADAETLETKMKVDGDFKTVKFIVGQQPAYKRRLQLGMTDDVYGKDPGAVQADGFAFAGDRNWKALQKTPYVMDPFTQGIYVTTAAVAGQYLKLAKQPPPQPVKTYDLSQEIRDWLGDKAGAYTCEIKLDVRVGPE